MVTPSCFNVKVEIASSSAIEAERVYGSPGDEIPEHGVVHTHPVCTGLCCTRTDSHDSRSFVGSCWRC